MSADVDGLCSLAPVSAGRADDLLAVLKGLPKGPESPFAQVEGTHFARFVIVPPLRNRFGEQADAISYLLFASEFDGPLDRYLENLRAGLGDAIQSIWSLCAGYPGEEGASAFTRYLLAHRVEAGYSAAAYPGVSAREVRQSLELRDRLADFAIRTAGERDPAALQREWRRAFHEQPR